MTVDAIVFGPVTGAVGFDFTSWQLNQVGPAIPEVRSCFCRGPQPGQTKCPCVLEGESKQGRRMIDEGVVIDGQKYHLVSDEGTGG